MEGAGGPQAAKVWIGSFPRGKTHRLTDGDRVRCQIGEQFWHPIRNAHLVTEEEAAMLVDCFWCSNPRFMRENGRPPK